MLRRLPTSELMHSMPVMPFQTARDLYKQTRGKEGDEESYEERELYKKKREWNRSSYHVNNQGYFTDSDDDDDDDEDMHSQLKRMALANTVPTSLFCKASTLAKANQKKEQENMKKRPASTSISQFLSSKESKFSNDKEEGKKKRNEGEKSIIAVESSGIKEVALSSKMVTPSIKQSSTPKQPSPSTPSIKQSSTPKQPSPSTPSIKQSSPSTPSKQSTSTTKPTSSKASTHTSEKKVSPSRVETSSILPNQSVLSLSSTIDKGKYYLSFSHTP